MTHMYVVSYKYLGRDNTDTTPSFMTASLEGAKQQIATIFFNAYGHRYNRNFEEFKEKALKCEMNEEKTRGKIKVEEDDLYILQLLPIY